MPNSPKEQFMPIDEVESDILLDPGNSIRFPDWVDRSQVGIDVRHIERMCRFAGINTLTIRTTNNSIFRAKNRPDMPDEPDVLDDIAVDVIESVHRVVGKDLEKEWAKQISVPKSVRTSKPIEVMCHKSDVTINLNMDAIESRTANEDIDAMLEIINFEVATCLRSAGAVELGAVGFNVLGSILYLLLTVIGKKLGGPPTALLLPILTSMAVMIMYQMQGKSPRFSLTGLTGMEIDRLAVFSCLGRTRTLIRRVAPQVC